MTDSGLTKVPDSSLAIIDTAKNLNQGTRLKFIDGRWTAADGRDMTGARLLVVHMTRGLRRWRDDGPPEDMSEDEGPLPDPKELNEMIPKSGWRRGLNGEPEPPWQINYPVYLIDSIAYEIFTSINSTWGQKIAWDKLKTQIKICSGIKKMSMCPMVKLGSAQMGGKMQKLRPDFSILADEWVSLTGLASGDGLKALASPTMKEEMNNDSIPF